LKNYSVVTEAIARMNVSGKDIRNTNFGNAPLATPEVVDLGCEYAQVKDMVHNMYPPDAEYMYTLVQDAVSGKSKLRQRREKGQPSYSDTDSEWSSLERRQRASEVYSKVNRKSGTHKRQRKKRTAIPVQPPRVPQLGGFTLPSVHSTPHVELDADKTNVGSESNSDSSEGSDAEQARTGTTDSRNRFSQKRSFSLKKRVPVSELHNTHNLNIQLHSPDLFSIKPNSYGIHDDESSLDVSSPRDNNSPMFGVLPKMKESDREKLLRKREKQKAKDDSKLEKQRRLKEEKLRKVADKEKERDKKKQQKIKQKAVSLTTAPSKLSDFIQNENNYIPIFLEKCVKFIESEGLESEGIYRVPGNRAHVDLLFQKFDEDSNVDIHELDIPVNAVATALKDFVSKRLPPLFEEEVMSELEEIAVPGTRIKPMATTTGNVEVKTDRSCRLLALRSMLEKLPKVNFQVLKFVFQHFVKVAENSKLNNMDSKNLAICWWPTLLPIEFSDMGRFEQMRPYLEDIVQTMINQYPFLFCGKEAFVMV
jgi:glucocorticoid receptor DNA-binding factor 1